MSAEVNKLGHAPHPQRPNSAGEPPHDAYHEELQTYIRGLILAVVLTAIPFGLVDSHAMTGTSLLIAIGVFALVQAVVHFRYFLHIQASHEHVDQIVMIVFTAVILIMMAGGTIWILGNLHSRMY